MNAGRVVLFSVGALLVAYAAVRVINHVVARNGGTELIPDPFAELAAKLSK